MTSKWTNPYKYTSPRVPITARFRGPGPARYDPLYTIGKDIPDSTKLTAPKYTARPKCPFKYETIGPGPAGYGLKQGLIRHGPYTEPGKSMGQRVQLKFWMNKMSSADYKHELSKSTKDGCNPKYSIRMRTRYFRSDNYPAPNRYVAPNTIGPHQPCYKEPPSFTMRAKCIYDKAKEIPGPGTYEDSIINIYRPRAPKYTMRPFTQPPKELGVKPGPNAYARHLVTSAWPRSATFKMGLRHSEFTTPLIVDVDSK